ncbi:BLUF domain-containing protein [Sulfitobacter sp.]|jgi:uncharacterized protein YacL (UPF0231 family)|uniref:BLUF domain-containing protein n=1 Tax=Sulfitobacter sp. TaxID=1903071 RepID=UPI00356240F6|tara:strand:+ start:1675 stop:2001 length:327 start_codon:yes stop_codon:yes gene_type:complete
MIRLLYFSTARASLSTSDVTDIVTLSQKKNAERGVTGALAFNGRNFCQLLEGDEQVVRGLVQDIEKDQRHSGFKIIDEKAIDTRHFADWSMLFVDELDFSTVINAMQA